MASPPAQAAMSTGPLASERVIINGPMSFAGAAQRSWRLIGIGAPWLLPVTIPLALALVVTWWSLIAMWYAIPVLFAWWLFILIIPYRLLRRGARKRKKQALQHRELLEAIERSRR
jgi:Flp pilus assembly protein TadB